MERPFKMSEIIKLDNASIGFDKIPIINGINLSIEAGGSWAVMGPNGGGKTTLLKTLIGVAKPVNGTYLVSNDVRFGYVPQTEKFDRIFPISVREIIAMGRYSRVPFGKMIKKQDWEIIDKAIDQTGVSHLEKSSFSSLSGGESRRVLIARAIAGEPDVLALDEPTMSVDSKGRAEIIDLIKKIKEKSGLTVIIVSHHAGSVKDLVQNFLFVDKDRNLVRSQSRDDFLKENNLEGRSNA